jgi:hypothetical protein
MTSMLFLAAPDASVFSPQLITLIAGIVLMVVGLFGGGIEVREIKVPTMPLLPRLASLLIGSVLTGLVLFHPSTFELSQSNATPVLPTTTSDKTPQTTQSDKKELGAAIPRLLEVKDVKKILSQLGYYNGALNSNEPDDLYFQAVANFQHSKAIKQDGLVGGETYGKLREAAPWYFGDKQEIGDKQQFADNQQIGDAKSQVQPHQ